MNTTELKALAEDLAKGLLEAIDGPAFHVPHYMARQAAAELRRLAQVEAEHEALKKAISDAVPVAWKVSIPDEPELGDWFAEDPCGDGYTNMPLYTLEGIRTKP